MTILQPVYGNTLKFSRMIGTGGIGSGMFFTLEGNHTLGRNESRMGKLLQFKDYCKLHIISHYVSVFLGAGTDKGFDVYSIGKVGEDDTGKRLLKEMKSAGIDTRHVSIETNCSTLLSVCFQYPDYTGGNITTVDSASSRVAPEDIVAFFDGFNGSKTGELFLSAPEVPVNTRIKLLEYGKKRGSYNIASLLSSEADTFYEMQGYKYVDLLSVNIDEARSIAHIDDETCNSDTITDRCIHELTLHNPGISVLITDGPHGSYSYVNGRIEHTSVPDVEVVATAGSGDTFLAGTIIGLCCGLPLSKGRNDSFFSETPLCSAVELGTLLASLAVTSPDAIHQTADARLLQEFAISHGIRFSPEFTKLFSGRSDKDVL